MFRKRFFSFVLAIFFISGITAQNQSYQNYIDRYKHLAIREMKRAGIPASIKLGQAILESGAGSSELAINANNHFGIKCGSNWNGKTYLRKDDDRDAAGNLIHSCFRVFPSVESGFMAHSDFLKDPKKEWRYGPLFKLETTDYKAWAKGLKKYGYATSNTYHRKLIKVIEDHKLYRYDQAEQDEVAEKTKEFDNNTFAVNGVRYVLSQTGESLSSISDRVSINEVNLFFYNDQYYNIQKVLAPGTKVFVESKKSAYRGPEKEHLILSWRENMFAISQRYGIRLDKLYERNLMTPGTQPAKYEVIKLRGRKVKDNPDLAPELNKLSEEAIKGAKLGNSVLIAIGLRNLVNSELEEPGEKKDIKPPLTTEKKVFHTVRKGDTLWNISRRYNTTVTSLKQLNYLTSDTISLGKVLIVK